MSGKLKSTDAARAEEIVGVAAEEYGYPVNFERLRRAELLAEKRGIKVSQLAYAWLMHQPLNLFGLTGTSSEKHIRETVEALEIKLSDAEAAWLNLETDQQP